MLGERLKQARNNKDLSQRKLAELIKVKHNSICDWEKGRHRPDLEQIRQLSEVLDVKASWLLGENEKTNTNSDISNFLTGKIDDLPEKAREELDNFIDYLKIKYSK